MNAHQLTAEDEAIIVATIQTLDRHGRHSPERLAVLVNAAALLVAMQAGLSRDEWFQELRASWDSLAALNRPPASRG